MNRLFYTVAVSFVFALAWGVGALAYADSASARASADSALREVGGALAEDDEVVLLEDPLGGGRNELGISNNDMTMPGEAGFCFGLTRAEEAFMTRIKFDMSAPKDSVESASEKIAAAIKGGQEVTVGGFLSLKEYLQEAGATEKLKSIIRDAQANAIKAVGDDGFNFAMNELSGGAMQSKVEKFFREVASPEAQAEKIEGYIRSQKPVPLSMFSGAQSPSGFKADANGHEVLVVGFVKGHDGKIKALLVKDPNEPGKLKAVSMSRGAETKWSYDPKSKGVPAGKDIALGIPQASDLKKSYFDLVSAPGKPFTNVKPISPEANPGACHRVSSNAGGIDEFMRQF